MGRTSLRAGVSSAVALACLWLAIPCTNAQSAAHQQRPRGQHQEQRGARNGRVGRSGTSIYPVTTDGPGTHVDKTFGEGSISRSGGGSIWEDDGSSFLVASAGAGGGEYSLPPTVTTSAASLQHRQERREGKLRIGGKEEEEKKEQQKRSLVVAEDPGVATFEDGSSPVDQAQHSRGGIGAAVAAAVAAGLMAIMGSKLTSPSTLDDDLEGVDDVALTLGLASPASPGRSIGSCGEIGEGSTLNLEQRHRLDSTISVDSHSEGLKEDTAGLIIISGQTQRGAGAASKGGGREARGLRGGQSRGVGRVALEQEPQHQQQQRQLSGNDAGVVGGLGKGGLFGGGCGGGGGRQEYHRVLQVSEDGG